MTRFLCLSQSFRYSAEYVDKVPDPTATSLAAADAAVVVLISDCEMRKIESKNGKNYLIDCKIQNFSIQSTLRWLSSVEPDDLAILLGSFYIGVG